MKVIDEGDRHAIFQCTGLQLLDSLPPESVHAVLCEADGSNAAAHEFERVLKPGGLVFAIGSGWPEHLTRNGITVFSDQKVCLAGKDTRRFLFHALTCTEEKCDSCSIQHLTEMSTHEIADELVRYVSTEGIVVVPWNYALMESVVRRHLTAITAREL